MTQIKTSTYQFLTELSKNNQREWFQENKPRYIAAHENVIAFADRLLALLGVHDELTTPSGKKSLMRIYRDVRFSKDKSPYHPRFAGSFSRIKPQLRGGYFFRLMPGETVVGGGFYGPSPEDLKHLRAQIAADDRPLREVLASRSFQEVFGELQGEQLKKAPKGYEADHPAIDLLRHKSLYAFHEFTDEEALSEDFVHKALAVFLAIRPFFDVMTEMLTTDLNGVSLIEK